MRACGVRACSVGLGIRLGLVLGIGLLLGLEMVLGLAHFTFCHTSSSKNPGVSLKADRTTAQSSDCAVVRSDHANYDRRTLIICR